MRDGSLGPDAGVQPGTLDTPTGVEVQIDESLGVRSGESIFHSFEFFDVGAGDGVHFSADAGVDTDRVISRVTGGETSNIFGRIRSSVPGADVFLLNPAGIVFGEGASLDVDGSFYGSTADRLVLGDEGFFSVQSGVPSVLRSAPPSAFGFFAASAGEIAVQDTDLAVPAGEALWLAGSQVSVGEAGGAASLSTPGGHLALVAAGTGGVVVEFDPSSPHSPPAPASDIQGGRVGLGDASTLDVGGTTPGSVHVLASEALLGGVVAADGLGSGEAGSVRVEVSDALQVSGRLSADARGEGDAGEVAVVGGARLQLASGALVAARSLPDAGASGSGDAGLVDLEVGSLDADPGARIDVSSAADSGGDAGRVRIESEGRIRFTGSGSGGLDFDAADGVAADSGMLAVSHGDGDAGSIEIAGPAGRPERAPSLVLREGAVVSAASRRGSGGGTIDVSARRVGVQSGSLVDASTLEGARGGDVGIEAASKIAVRGTGADGSPSQVRSITAGPGDAGSLRLAAPRVEITDGGRLSTVAVPAAGEADAGAIEVRAERLRVREGAVVDSSSFGEGQAGRIQLIGLEGETARRVVVDGADTRVTGKTGGPGDGNELLVQAERIRVRDGAVVSTRSAPGLGTTGGALADLADVEVGGRPLSATLAALDQADREVEGAGGLLRLRAGRGIVVRGGRIESVARGDGAAGDIAIESPRLRVDAAGVITASTSGAGSGGRITVEGVERVRLLEGAVIESISSAGPDVASPGDAGAIRIDGERGAVIQIVDSRVETSSRGGGGGFIAIGADDGQIGLTRAAIRTDVTEGDRKAGNIVFRAQKMVATASEIVARADRGEGGAIDILVSDFQPSADTLIASTSEEGFDGRVRVRSPETLVATTPVAPAEPEFLDPIALLRRDCQARAASDAVGSFTVEPVPVQAGRSVRSVAWAPSAPGASASPDPAAPAAPTPAWQAALEARSAADSGRRPDAEAALERLDAVLGDAAGGEPGSELWIHAAGTWAALARGASGEAASADLLRAHDLLREAARRAARSGDEAGRAWALGHLAELYRREARLDEADRKSVV